MTTEAPDRVAAVAAFVADTTAELHDRVHLYRRWLVDCARDPAPHRDGTFVALLTRGLDLIIGEIDRRTRFEVVGHAGKGGAHVAKVRPWRVARSMT